MLDYTVQVSRLPDDVHEYMWQATIDLDVNWLNSWPGRV